MARVNLAAFRGLGRWLALMAALLGLCFASVFAGRRFLDSWRRDLDGAELLMLTAMLVGALTGFRRLWRGARITSFGRPGDLVIHALPSLAALLLAAAVSGPDAPVWGVIVLWSALASVETWFWSQLTPVWRRVQSRRATTPPIVDHARDQAPETIESPPSGHFPPNRLQQLTRFRDEEGAEVIQGTLRAELKPGQRVHHLHVAFCPPLPSIPEFAFEQTDGPEAALTLGQIETYGARLDLRLASPAEEGERLVVEFYARCGWTS
jgi:hypothetical protein